MNTSVDYFGLMNVKRGRVTEKRWTYLFKCLTTRAAHLKLAGDLSTDSFIMALRKFCGRGNPKTMLRTMERTLSESKNVKECEVTESRTDHQRAHLRRDHLVLQPVNGQVLPEETLHTVFVEAEAIVNSRLLTAVSYDVNNYVALTPNHYLIKRASNNSPPGQFEEGKINSRKWWRMAQVLADMIWQ